MSNTLAQPKEKLPKSLEFEEFDLARTSLFEAIHSRSLEASPTSSTSTLPSLKIITGANSHQASRLETGKIVADILFSEHRPKAPGGSFRVAEAEALVAIKEECENRGIEFNEDLSSFVSKSLRSLRAVNFHAEKFLESKSSLEGLVDHILAEYELFKELKLPPALLRKFSGQGPLRIDNLGNEIRDTFSDDQKALGRFLVIRSLVLTGGFSQDLQLFKKEYQKAEKEVAIYFQDLPHLQDTAILYKLQALRYTMKDIRNWYNEANEIATERVNADPSIKKRLGTIRHMLWKGMLKNGSVSISKDKTKIEIKPSIPQERNSCGQFIKKT